MDVPGVIAQIERARSELLDAPTPPPGAAPTAESLLLRAKYMVLRAIQSIRDHDPDAADRLERRIRLAWWRATGQRDRLPASSVARIDLNRFVHLAPHEADVRGSSLLVAVPVMTLGGAEQLLQQVLSDLAKRGWHISIVTTVDPAPLQGDTTHLFTAITGDVFKLPDLLDPGSWTEFLCYLLTIKRVDCLLIVGSVAVYERIPALKAFKPGLKIADLLFNAIGYWTFNRTFSSAIDLTFAENGEVAGKLQRSGGQVAFVPSGVDLNAFHPRNRSSDLRAALGCADEDVLVGFSGRWSQEKNPLAFLDIVERLANDRGLHFVMTGSGPLQQQVLDRYRRSPVLQKRLLLVGVVQDVGAIIAQYDLLALPSSIDGRPVVVMEALASGVPVIASRVGGLPELVQHDETGALCAPGDLEAFASAIRIWAGNPAKLDEGKRAARRFARTHLDAKAMLDRYAEAFSALRKSVGGE